MKRSLSKEHKAKEFNSRKLRKVTAVNKIPPHLPDIVTDKVLGHLATNESLRMSFLSKQWRSVWSYFQATNPIIDFDEGGENDDHNTDQHKRFISSLRSYLVQYDEDDQHKGNLDKFRLNMTRYLPEDAGMVSKLLFISFERGLKELDMSLYGGGCPPERYYTLSPTSLACYAKSLTALKLECVRVKEMNCAAAGGIHRKRHRSLPFLKTMSLKNVDLDSGAALYVLMKECPAIEHLSFISCSFEYDIIVRSSSLKSLEVEQCEARKVYIKAVNLESLTILLSNSKLNSVSLTKCFKLKHMNIYAQYMKFLNLHGCIAVVEGTIDAPRMSLFTFEGDHLKSKFSLKAPKLVTASITLRDNQGQGAEHFVRFKEFLEGFGSTEDIAIAVHDFRDLVIPEMFRKGFSSILPKLEDIIVNMVNPPMNMRERKDLCDSLSWMSPSLKNISEREKILQYITPNILTVGCTNIFTSNG